MFRRHAMIGLVISAGVTAACTDSVVPVAPNTFEFAALRDGLRRGQCFTQLGLNGTQVEPGADGNASVTAPNGEIVTQVAVKGGIPCWFTPSDVVGTYTITVDEAPCYVVAGLGTPTATITRVGAGPSCKDISHVEFASAARPTTGALRICPVLSGTAPPGVQGVTFTFTVAGQQIAVASGTCSDVIEQPGIVTLVEAPAPFDLFLTTAVTAPSDRLVNVDVAMQSVTVNIVTGSTTEVTITNVFGEPDPGGDHVIVPPRRVTPITLGDFVSPRINNGR